MMIHDTEVLSPNLLDELGYFILKKNNRNKSMDK